MKCQVCNELEALSTFNSSIDVNVKRVYCLRCATYKIEPYEDVVNYLAQNNLTNYNALTQHWVEDVMDNTIEFFGKTPEQLMKDVQDKIEELKHIQY